MENRFEPVVTSAKVVQACFTHAMRGDSTFAMRVDNPDIIAELEKAGIVGEQPEGGWLTTMTWQNTKSRGLSVNCIKKHAKYVELSSHDVVGMLSEGNLRSALRKITFVRQMSEDGPIFKKIFQIVKSDEKFSSKKPNGLEKAPWLANSWYDQRVIVGIMLLQEVKTYLREMCCRIEEDGHSTHIYFKKEAMKKRLLNC